MKKLVLLIVAMLLFSIMAVRAEGIDLSGMTTEELIELDLQISEELHSRESVTNNYLYQGNYTVGEDLEEGRYVFKCTKVLDDKYQVGMVKVTCDDGSHYNSHADMRLGEEWSVRLVNGDYVRLIYLDCAIDKID